MKTSLSSSPQTDSTSVFGKRCCLILVVACVLIIFGYVLMSGQGSNEQTFEPGIFSSRRIVFAPIFCLAGYLLIIVGILQKE